MEMSILVRRRLLHHPLLLHCLYRSKPLLLHRLLRWCWSRPPLLRWRPHQDNLHPLFLLTSTTQSSWRRLHLHSGRTTHTNRPLPNTTSRVMWCQLLRRRLVRRLWWWQLLLKLGTAPLALSQRPVWRLLPLHHLPRLPRPSPPLQRLSPPRHLSRC